MRGTFDILAVLAMTVWSALFQTSETVLFQKLQLSTINMCAMPPINAVPPVMKWTSMSNLTSSATWKKMSECCLYCEQDPKCRYFQIVRMDDEAGFCHLFSEIKSLISIDENYCKSYMKAEKKLNCYLHWNPDNFLSKTKKNVYRLEKLDKSWIIYNETRGLHLVEMDAAKCVPAKHSVFDTINGATEQKKLKSYIDQLTPGVLLAGFSVGEILDQAMASFLANMGISYSSRESFSLAFICKNDKGLKCQNQISWMPRGFTVFLDISDGKNNTFMDIVINNSFFFFIYQNLF